jgi:hypothetical protein
MVSRKAPVEDAVSWMSILASALEGLHASSRWKIDDGASIIQVEGSAVPSRPPDLS